MKKELKFKNHMDENLMQKDAQMTPGKLWLKRFYSTGEHFSMK